MSCAAAAQGFRGTTFCVHLPASDGRQEPQTLWLVLYETMFLNILQGTPSLVDAVGDLLTEGQRG